jgi:hypothetical protein
LLCGREEAERADVARGGVVSLGAALEERFIEILAELDLAQRHGSAAEGRTTTATRRTAATAARRGAQYARGVYDAKRRGARKRRREGGTHFSILRRKSDANQKSKADCLWEKLLDEDDGWRL